MKKIAFLPAVALSLVISGVASAKNQKPPTIVGGVHAVKNQHAKFAKPIVKSGWFEPHITIDNDTFHVLTVNTKERMTILFPGDIADFTYEIFSPRNPAVSIVSDDNRVLYHNTVNDETYVHVTATDYSYAATDYLVFMEAMH